MNKIFKIVKIFLLLSLFAIFSYCGTIKEGFSNQKKNSSEEFLVEKKSPLVMPPEFNELPKPLENNEKIQKRNNIKELIAVEDGAENNISNENSNLEQKLLKKIKK